MIGRSELGCMSCGRGPVETVAGATVGAESQRCVGCGASWTNSQQATATVTTVVVPPRRRFEVVVSISGDAWEDVAAAVRELLPDLVEHGPKCNSISGGYTSGSWVQVIESPEVTHDSYVEALERYLADRKAREASERYVLTEGPRRGQVASNEEIAAGLAMRPSQLAPPAQEHRCARCGRDDSPPGLTEEEPGEWLCDRCGGRTAPLQLVPPPPLPSAPEVVPGELVTERIEELATVIAELAESTAALGRLRGQLRLLTSQYDDLCSSAVAKLDSIQGPMLVLAKHAPPNLRGEVSAAVSAITELRAAIVAAAKPEGGTPA